MSKQSNPANIIIDFDSTIVTIESLDELAKIALQHSKDSQRIQSEIEHITNLGMEGKIGIDESLKRRLAVITANKTHIASIISKLETHISPSFKHNIKFLEENRDRIFILSAGFKDYITPIAVQLNLRPDHIYANTFTFDNLGNIIGLDSDNLLSQVQGKVKQIKALNLTSPIHVIGDGFTDYEIKALSVADKFFCFTETVNRKSVSDKADYVISNFDEYINFKSY